MQDSPVVEVIAGVIRDARDRILLARRTAGRDLAGLWEFPGGKREAGETPEAALARELDEELGIAIDIGATLIAVPQQYPGKRLRLDVRHIAAWRGTPRGHEGQALAWVPPHKLADYAMPPADRPVVAALLQPDRYLVTPEPDVEGGSEADRAWLMTLDAAIDSGLQRLQVRLPHLDRKRRHALLSNVVVRCQAAGIDLLVNGDIALAREFGIGLHLRAAQLREHRERPLSVGITLGASCHDADELRQAESIGCNFAVLGPLKATPTHPDAAGIGWARFARLREQVSLPIYAIGGLAPDDIADARQHGAQGIAAIRSLWPGTPINTRL